MGVPLKSIEIYSAKIHGNARDAKIFRWEKKNGQV